MSDYIGSTLSIFAGATSVEDESSYDANSYTAIGRIVNIGEIGDTQADLSANYLDSGRTNHSNGVADGGECTVEVESLAADAGLAIVRAGVASGTTHSLQIADPDGTKYWFQGVVGSFRHRNRTTDTRKGFTFVIRINTAITESA